MPQEVPTATDISQRQRIGLLVAGGVAVGLGGFAIWYIRRKNLAKRPPPPPRAQLDLTPTDPPSEPPIEPSTTERNGEPPETSDDRQNGQESSASTPGQVAEEADDKKAGGAGSNGQHTHSDLKSQGPLPLYGWAQTRDEAYLVTTCPLDVKPRDVSCKIQPSSLHLTVRGEAIASGELFAAVDSSESIWEFENLVDKKKLTVTLVKALNCSGQAADWPLLLKGNPMPALNTIVA